MTAIGCSVAFVGILTFLLYKLLQFLKFKRIIDKIHGPRDETMYIGNYMQLRKMPAGNRTIFKNFHCSVQL